MDDFTLLYKADWPVETPGFQDLVHEYGYWVAFVVSREDIRAWRARMLELEEAADDLGIRPRQLVERDADVLPQTMHFPRFGDDLRNELFSYENTTHPSSPRPLEAGPGVLESAEEVRSLEATQTRLSSRWAEWRNEGWEGGNLIVPGSVGVGLERLLWYERNPNAMTETFMKAVQDLIRAAEDPEYRGDVPGAPTPSRRVWTLLHAAVHGLTPHLGEGRRRELADDFAEEDLERLWAWGSVEEPFDWTYEEECGLDKPSLRQLTEGVREQRGLG